MPVVRAADYPYTPYPTVATPQESDALNSAFQRIQTSPDMFGAATGRALQQFGATLESASDKMAGTALYMQDIHNKTVVDQQITSYEEKVNKVLYGDPNVQGDAGYFGLKGNAALQARQGVNAQLEQIRKEHEATTQNQRQRIDFNTQSRRYNAYATTKMNQHYEAEFTRNAQDVMQGRAGVALTNAGIASNNNDFEAFKSAWGTGRAALIDSYNIPGRESPPELQEARLREYDEKAVTDWAVKLATRDPVAADAFVDANRDYLPTKYDDVKRAVKAEKDKADVNYVANGGPRPGGAPSMVPRSGTLPQGSFFNRIVNAGERSAQSAVSPSGAVGVSQIKPSTAQEVASERGIPYDEERLKTDEKYNRQLGEAYANKMLQKYGGNEMLAAAAYNAGPGKVDEWIKEIGDPRTGKITPEEWARKIPVAETKDYVYRVAPPGATRLGGTAQPSGASLGAPPRPGSIRGAPEVPSGPGGLPGYPGTAGTPPPAGGYPAPRPVSGAVSPGQRGLPTTEEARPLEVWGDSLGAGLNSRLQTPGRSTGGAQPAAILADIKKEPEGRWAGKTVVLSSGSNGNDMGTVEETAAYLKQHGANVLLVGYGPKFQQKNSTLAAIANKVGARVVPAQGVDPQEGVHPSPEGYNRMVQEIRTQPGVGQRGAATPTLTPPGAPPPEPAAGAAPAPALPEPGSGGGTPAEVLLEPGAGSDVGGETSGIPAAVAEEPGGGATEGSGGSLPPRDVLLGNMPPPDAQTVGDTELSQYGELYKAYRQKLEAAADRAVEGGYSIDTWHKAAKQIRTEFTAAYMDQRRAEQELERKTAKIDKELQDKFITRMAPESTNPPTTQEILTSAMSPAAKENIFRFLKATTTEELGPTAKESAANQAELYRRLTLPDDDPAKIRSERDIQKAYHTDRLITWNAMAALTNEFRQLYSATRSQITAGVADVIKAAQPKIRPSLSMPNGHLMESVQDSEGPNRELAFKRYVDDQVNKAEQAGKNPLATVLNPDSPDFVGKDLKRWQKGGPSINDRINEGKGKPQTFTDPKTTKELQDQHNAGRWGPPESQESKDAAYAEALRLGLIRSPLAPPMPGR